MKRISVIIILALALGGGALAVAQEPDQPTDQPNAAPYPNQADKQAHLSPLAAEVDNAIKTSIDRSGRTAVAAEAKPVAEATASDCMTTDEYENINVLLTKMAEVKSRLAEVESERHPPTPTLSPKPRTNPKTPSVPRSPELRRGRRIRPLPPGPTRHLCRSSTRRGAQPMPRRARQAHRPRYASSRRIAQRLSRTATGPTRIASWTRSDAFLGERHRSRRSREPHWTVAGSRGRRTRGDVVGDVTAHRSEATSTYREHAAVVRGALSPQRQRA